MLLIFASLICTSSSIFAQTEFSADIVNQEKMGTNSQAKVYFGKDKMRFESADHNSKGGGAFIVNIPTHTSTILLPQQHMYMEMPQQSMEQRGFYSFFEAGDVENACVDWMKLPRHQGGTCHKDGHEIINGRDTIKYEGTNSNGETSSVWLDPKLRFPVKWQEKNGAGELRNIQEGAQPASLFEVPAGYTKMDIGAMMQQRQK
jgi:hypothetical protein